MQGQTLNKLNYYQQMRCKYNYIVNRVIKQMRSLIKMQMSKYPIGQVVPINQLPFKQQQPRYSGAATHHSMRNTLKRNSIYNNISFRNESYTDVEDEDGKKRESERKKSIEKYISDLTTDIQNPKNQPDFGETKLKVLKRIIQHYDIKTMQKNHYSKLIKTFGLQIEPARTERKQIKSHNTNRSFKIKQSPTRESARLYKLKNRLEGQGQGQVALFQFSKELVPTKKEENIRKKSFTSQSFIQKNKQKFRIVSNQKKMKQNAANKKMSPFKFSSMQDIVIQKINKFREFLFTLNCSNHLYRKMDLPNYQAPLKFYVGPGNNSNLIKSLLKKRFYFEQTYKIKQANFIWTQIKIDQIFNLQNNSTFFKFQQNKKLEKRENKLRFPMNSEIQQSISRVLTKHQAFVAIKNYEQFSKKLNNSSFQDKLKYFDKKFNNIQIQQTNKVHNHLPSNGLLGNKKGMFYCIREYYKLKGGNVWDILPLTFHISKGFLDTDFKQFSNYYTERKKNKLPNVWIMKPGEFSNRGNGISCSNKMQQIRKRVGKCHVGKNGQAKTLILQLYISNPMLYNGRKFDIRVYMLVTCHNGKLKGYWYQQGYIRTSSYFFDLNELTDNDIHLTNDAIQKKSDNYGKFQPGNKLSYSELQRYLDSLPPNGRNLDFYLNALPKMKEIAGDALKSSFMFLDQNRKQNNFEIFGMDYMLDYNLKPWLIQINTNPCLELSCPLLERIIPHMVQNAFRIGLDTIFPPPDYVPHNYKYNIPENALHYNKFQLIFDEQRDGPQVRQLYEAHPGSSTLISSLMGIKQDQEVFQEEGILCDYDL